MTVPTHRDWPDTRLWAAPREYGQPSAGYQGGYPGIPPAEPSSSSTSIETDPSEDSTDVSEYVPENIPEPMVEYPDFIDENHPHSMSVSGPRDHSDSRPEGSHQGHAGWISTDSSDSWIPERYHRNDTSFEGPSRSGHDGQLSSPPITPPPRSPSRSPSVTSRRYYPEIEEPEEPEHRGRRRPYCSDGAGPSRTRPEAPEVEVTERRLGDRCQRMYTQTARTLRDLPAIMRSRSLRSQLAGSASGSKKV